MISESMSNEVRAIGRLVVVCLIVFAAMCRAEQPSAQQQKAFADCMAEHDEKVPSPPPVGTMPQPPQAFIDCMTQQGQTLPQPPQGGSSDSQQPPQLTDQQQAALQQCQQYLPQGSDQGTPPKSKAFEICRQKSLSGQ